MHNLKLSEEIKRAINELGYTEATPVQKAVIPVALTGEDIVAKSQTGSGKTAAFAIPIAEQVEWEENKPQALIIVPTRELAMQVKTECTNIGRFKRVKAAKNIRTITICETKIRTKPKKSYRRWDAWSPTGSY